MNVHPQVTSFQAGQVVTVAGEDFTVVRVRMDHLMVVPGGNDHEMSVYTETVEAVRPGGKDGLARVARVLKRREATQVGNS